MLETPAVASPTTTAFPGVEVEQRLHDAVTQLGEMTASMRQPWEPTFDSLAVVNIVLVVESLLPGLKIAPEKVVRKGGYATAKEAASDMTSRLRRQWDQQQK